MDLIALLASAPPWVRYLASVLALVWALATAITNALRAVPEERYVAVERAWPRLGQLLRAARKFGTDVWPFLVALVAALFGRPVHPVAPPPPQPPSGQRGHARVGVLAVVVAVALALGLALVVGCGPARETVMRLAPGVPEPSGCAATTQRCNGAVPEVCSSSGRWWPSLPVRPDGTQRACVSCVVEDGVAGCAL